MKKVLPFILLIFVAGLIYFNRAPLVHDYCMWKREHHDRAVIGDYQKFLEERSRIHPFSETIDTLIQEYTFETKKSSLNIAKECFTDLGESYPYLDDYYRSTSR